MNGSYLRITSEEPYPPRSPLCQLPSQIPQHGDPERIEKLKGKIEGFIASLKPIYPEKLPPQIAKPYSFFLQSLKGIPIEKKKISLTKPLIERNKSFREKPQANQKQTCLIQWM